MIWNYGARIAQDGKDFVVSVRDLPEVVTAGNTLAEALDLAQDAIDVAVSGRIDDNMALAEPTPLADDEYPVALPLQTAATATVYRLWWASKMSKTEMARRMNLRETEVRRILDPRHGTRLETLEAAARVLGARLVIDARPI
jgi:antitoxin HicB